MRIKSETVTSDSINKTMGAIFSVLYSKVSEQKGIFSSSWERNATKEIYSLFAGVGECTPIAYDSEETGLAFVRHIVHTVDKGQDFAYQPLMRVSRELRGKDILACTFSDTPTPDNLPLIRLPQNVSNYELSQMIAEDADEINAKVVIITNAEQGITHCCGQAVSYLNDIAEKNGLVILALFNIEETTDEANGFLANHAHNLCQLTEESITTTTDEEGSTVHNYIAFRYGRPTQHYVAYGMDEHGDFTFVPHINKLLRMRTFGKMFAEKPVTITKFIDTVFGATNGEFEKQSIYNAISLAINNGILSKSGDASKTKVWVNNDQPVINPYKSNVAFNANAYLNAGDGEKVPTYRKSKGVIKFGDFRLITSLFDPEQVFEAAWLFERHLVEAVARQTKFLDFKLKTTHRNTLVLSVGEDMGIHEMRDRLGEIRGAKFDFVDTECKISDNDFLQTFRSLVNKKQYDFVFIFGMHLLTPETYTVTQLCNEIAKTAKQKGIVAIAQTEKLTDEEMNDLGEKVWTIEPLLEQGDLDDARYAYGMPKFPQIFTFRAKNDKGQFVCNFKEVSCMKLAKGEYIKARLATYLIWAAEYYSPREEINLTNDELSKAKKLGLCTIKYEGKKSWDNAWILFTGQRYFKR